MGIAAGDVAVVDPEVQKLYEARMGKCDYFVSTDGSDKNDGTDLQSPFESLLCACSSKCNEELQVRVERCASCLRHSSTIPYNQFSHAFHVSFHTSLASRADKLLTCQ